MKGYVVPCFSIVISRGFVIAKRSSSDLLVNHAFSWYVWATWRTVKPIPPPILWISMFVAPSSFMRYSWTRSPAYTGYLWVFNTMVTCVWQSTSPGITHRPTHINKQEESNTRGINFVFECSFLELLTDFRRRTNSSDNATLIHNNGTKLLQLTIGVTHYQEPRCHSWLYHTASFHDSS